MNPIIIDVREKDEFDAEHVEHSIHIPLSNFERQAPAILKSLRGQKVLLMCRSGKRAGLAAQTVGKFDADLECQVYEGGILEWKRLGRPTMARRREHLPILRQVQLIAGGLAFTGSLLGYFVNPAFLLLSGFIGLGLMVAGATGFCGMAELLARMPWNRTNPEVRQEVCAASPHSGGCPKPESHT